MAKNNNYKNKKNKDVKKKPEKRYVNPANRLWGKIIIAILTLAMAFGGLISLIYLIVDNA